MLPVKTRGSSSNWHRELPIPAMWHYWMKNAGNLVSSLIKRMAKVFLLQRWQLMPLGYRQCSLHSTRFTWTRHLRKNATWPSKDFQKRRHPRHPNLHQPLGFDHPWQLTIQTVGVARLRMAPVPCFHHVNQLLDKCVPIIANRTLDTTRIRCAKVPATITSPWCTMVYNYRPVFWHETVSTAAQVIGLENAEQLNNYITKILLVKSSSFVHKKTILHTPM